MSEWLPMKDFDVKPGQYFVTLVQTFSGRKTPVCVHVSKHGGWYWDVDILLDHPNEMLGWFPLPNIKG